MISRVSWGRRDSNPRPLNSQQREVRVVPDADLGQAHEIRKRLPLPKVRVSDLLGHKKVNLAVDVYDRSSLQDFEQALGQVVGSQL